MKQTKDTHPSRLAFGEKARPVRNPVTSVRPRKLGNCCHSGKHVGNFNSKELTRFSNFLYWYSEKQWHLLNTRHFCIGFPLPAC